MSDRDPSLQPVDADKHPAIAASELRWNCDREWLDFQSTADVKPAEGVVGQDDAIDALRFGLAIHGAGQNVFVRGLEGTGRLTLVEQVMRELRPKCRTAPDRCYVHNFSRPNQPRLITLEAGAAPRFERRVDELVDFIREDLVPSLSSDTMRARRTRLNEELQETIGELTAPFEKELAEAGLSLVPMQVGQTVQPTLLPLIEGEAVPFEKLAELVKEGKLEESEVEKLQERISEYARRFQDVSEQIHEMQRKHRLQVEEILEKEARRILVHHVNGIKEDFGEEAVATFLNEVVDGLVGRLRQLSKGVEFTDSYRVNVLISHKPDAPCPIIVENTPTLSNLLGNIERELRTGGVLRSDHMMIHGGSLLAADRGFLVLEARDVLNEPGAWKVLLRTLRSGKLEIVPYELTTFFAGPMLKPEAIEIEVKVVILGDASLFYLLDTYDPDFKNLFKVLADFESTIERNEQGARFYAQVIARLVAEEELLPFGREAIAALCEHGARIAARQDRLTTRFGRVADIAREAAFRAAQRDASAVERQDVLEAVRQSKRRADLPARRFRRLIQEGTIRIRTNGSEIGQVNGLAVVHAGPLTYGFPTRITATIGPGSAGTINIEREANLSGAIHTKGFYILGGLLRHLLQTEHPLAFSASLAFEQSYGGIDGDSASGAEMCCLLSALTEVPLRQDLAMTGAIDQKGNMQPIGAVTEKIEGFFDVCQAIGLTGRQGVIIPQSNAGELMLRPDVVEAARNGQFHVYAAEHITDALELFTGRQAGELDENDRYPEGTLLRRAQERARDYWRMAAAKPEVPEQATSEGEDEEEIAAESTPS